VARRVLPYRPLAEATGEQEMNEWTDVSGTVVGFRSPDYAQGLSVAWYHLHFISDDRTRGGHILDCTLAEGTLQADVESGLHLELPRTAAFVNADLVGHDLDRETDAAEATPAAE
jgi:acetolactate decarboxylase